MGSFEFIDHTADVIVRAEGKDRAEAFAEAARGMFAVITGESEITAEKTHQIEVDSIDDEGLLVTFLSELIVLHEADNWLFSQFEIEFEDRGTDEKALKATMRGEKFDRERHGHGIQVKGVSYHMLEIEDADDDRPARVQVLFDI